MKSFEIEQGIEIPEICRGRKPIYPFHELKKGESFLAPAKKKPSVAARAGRLGKELGRKFVIRATDEGVRVWRVK